MILLSRYPSESGLRGEIADMLDGWGAVPCPPGSFCRADLEEVAAAVAAYLEAEGRPASASRSSVPGLASRALCSLGERESARRVAVFGTGLARESASLVAGNGTLWVLDLRGLTRDFTDRLEMAFFPSVGAVLDCLSAVWEPSDGQGVLGLRHLRAAAGILSGSESTHAGARRLVVEIKSFCSHKLADIGAARGWTELPRVLEMDHTG